MLESLPGPVRAAIAPLAITLLFVAMVVPNPAIRLEHFVLIAENHVSRNYNVLAIALVAAIPASLVAQIARGRTGERPLAFLVRVIQERWHQDRLLSFVLPPFSFALLLSAFTSFKQWILPGAGFDMDSTFADIGRLIFLGRDGWQVTHLLLPWPIATKVFDVAYLIWFVPMILFVLLSGFLPLRIRTRYLIAFTLVWIVLGTVIAYLLPSAGPCYFETFHHSDRFAPLLDTLSAQNTALETSYGWNLLALSGQAELLQGYQSQTVMLAGGISAMPSLHVAMATLFACAGFALWRPLGVGLTLFALIIFIGSVHLGWHYAADGIVAAILTLQIWKVAGFATTHLLRETPATMTAEPQPA
ncbi:phosphatase PAP2 family protein [Stakelama marina]|uniref:Phosphatase PAP2 family protein n=1 Tax=Stakelama marina TaxID=2826939 RepID=A0A8T4IDM8_9SPHN|nr:phosphatase PAP2 family protein [Stakelama marina]MBR0551095.1 phosphatase PAP2 family protein [Stakelama marina]